MSSNLSTETGKINRCRSFSGGPIENTPKALGLRNRLRSGENHGELRRPQSLSSLCSDEVGDTSIEGDFHDPHHTPEPHTMRVSDKFGGVLRVQVTSSNLAASALPSPLKTGETTPLLAVGSGVRGTSGTRQSLSSTLKPSNLDSPPSQTEDAEESPGTLEDRDSKYSSKPTLSPLGLLEELSTPVGTAFRSLGVLFRSPRCSREESGPSVEDVTISPQPHPLPDTPQNIISQAVDTCWEQISNRLRETPPSLLKAAKKARQELSDKASHTKAMLARKSAALRNSLSSPLKRQESKETAAPTLRVRDSLSIDLFAGLCALLGGVLSTVPTIYPEAPESLAFWGNMLSTVGCLMTLRHGIVSDMQGQYEIWCATEARFEDKSEPPNMCIMNYLKSFVCKMKCQLDKNKQLDEHGNYVQAHLSLVREKVHLGAFCALFTQLLSDVVSLFEVPAMSNFLHSPLGMVVYWCPYLCCAGLGLISAVLCWLENCEECTGDECMLEYPQEVGVPVSNTVSGVWDFYDCGDGEWVGGDDDWWPEVDGTLDGFVDDVADEYPIPLTAGEKKKELKESLAKSVVGDDGAIAKIGVDMQKLSDYMNIIGSLEFMVYSVEQFAENVDQMLSNNTAISVFHSHSVYAIFLSMQQEFSLLVHMIPPSLFHHGGVLFIPMLKVVRILVSKSYLIGVFMMNMSSLLAVVGPFLDQKQVSGDKLKERLLSGRIYLAILHNLVLKLRNTDGHD